MTDGIFSLLAGLILLFLTGASQSLIVFLFALYAVILGVVHFTAARGEREPNQSTTYLRVIGIYSIIYGLFLLFFMSATLPTIIALIAAYGLITGGAEVIAAYYYRKDLGGYAWLISTGTIRVLFSLFLLFNLGVSLPVFILYLALYAIVVGITMTVFGYEVRAGIGKAHPAH
jgi:uncharacterized membrane protein HdeD (DUF308 family)